MCVYMCVCHSPTVYIPWEKNWVVCVSLTCRCRAPRCSLLSLDIHLSIFLSPSLSVHLNHLILQSLPAGCTFRKLCCVYAPLYIWPQCSSLISSSLDQILLILLQAFVVFLAKSYVFSYGKKLAQSCCQNLSPAVKENIMIGWISCKDSSLAL